jgi:hypothetical protein
VASISTDHFAQKFYTAGVNFSETFNLTSSLRVRILSITSTNPAADDITVSFNSGWGSSRSFTISGQYSIGVFTNNLIWHIPRGSSAETTPVGPAPPTWITNDPNVETEDKNLLAIDNEERMIIRFDPQLSPENVDWTITYLENDEDDDEDDPKTLSLTDQTVYNNFNVIRTQFSAYV